MDLNNAIQGYLTLNKISFTDQDYQTGQPDDAQDQILFWNAEKLGPQPNQQQLAAGDIYYTEQTIKKENTLAASAILASTDWTAIASIANPQVSQPYLTNQAEFLSYRSAVRAIGVNPPAVLATFPTQPIPAWSN